MNPSPDPSHSQKANNNAAAFPQTRWSLILEAKEFDPQALTDLCKQYWRPLYIYARRRGASAEDAEDQTQGFFAHILSKNFFQLAQPERGRLRNLMLTSFQNFTANEARKQQAMKRGGGVTPLSIDVDMESLLKIEPSNDITPEMEFERQWAREILAHARAKLQASYAEAGKSQEFDAFADHLETGEDKRPHSEIALELGIKKSSVRYVGFKLRQRFRGFLEATVAETVRDHSEAEEELQYLLKAFDR